MNPSIFDTQNLKTLLQVSSEIIENENAGIAQLVERNLAKVDVAGSSPVSRSIKNAGIHGSGFCFLYISNI